MRVKNEKMKMNENVENVSVCRAGIDCECLHQNMSGSGGYNGGGMMLGGQSQRNPSGNSSVVVGGGMSNNLFPTQIPPPVPNSPQFTRAMPKKGLGQPSPNHNAMPFGNPMLGRGISDLSMISSMSMNSVPMHGLMNNTMMPPIGAPSVPRTKIQCFPDPAQNLPLTSTNPPVNMLNPTNPTQSNATKGLSVNGTKQNSSMKMAPNGAGQNDGNMSPKSQASDNEGDDH